MKKEDIDFKDLEELKQNTELVLQEDLESLKKEDLEYRIELWNAIKSDFNTFRRQYQLKLPEDIKRDHRGDFKFAQLLLAASFRVNNENIPISNFSETEISLIQDFESYKMFDILSIEDIVERTHRREGKVYELVMDYSSKQYDNLDKIFDDPSIEKDLMYIFNKHYKKRQDKIKQAVEKYIEIYGPLATVREIKGVLDKIHESEQQRSDISAEVQKKIEELENRAIDAESLEQKNNELQEKISRLEMELYQKDVEKKSLEETLHELEKQKKSLVDQYSDIAKVWDKKMAEIEAKSQELIELEKELKKERDAYKSKLEKENERLIENELSKIEQMKKELLEKEKILYQEKSEIEHKKQEVDERLNIVKKAIEGGEDSNRFVTTDIAKVLELNFIARFDMKINSMEKGLLNPIDNKYYKINERDYEHLKTDSHDRIFNRYRLDYSEINHKLPLNMRSRYYLKNKILKLFKGSKTKVVIEAATLNHIDEYVNNGFDTRPATLSELLGVLTRYIEPAEIGRYFHVIGIASPTGWDKKVIETIKSEDFSKNYVSRFISICLIDSETGEVIFNDSDVRIRDYIELYKPKFETEKVNDAIKKINEALSISDFVALEELTNKHNLEERIVKKAFYELEKAKKGKVEYLKDVGLLFKKKR